MCSTAAAYPDTLYPSPRMRPDPLAVDRRRFLLSALTIGGSAFVLASCRRAPDIVEQPIDFIGADRRSGDPLYSQAAAAFVAVIPQEVLPEVTRRWSRTTLAGNLIALYEDCPRGDGVALRYCSSMQLYRCPVCESLFNRIGEQLFGPAPRGMDRRRVSIDADGQLVIDPTDTVKGPDSSEPLILGQRIEDPSTVSECRSSSILPPNPAGGSRPDEPAR